ncbi:uncharacterized protein LOC126991546 [Eriocheir sinensis]|uniref:uncharacterized protein LOC126991546 n=1 Tax=Eriocheir sinensis TaxID=95602 RepID=UPI0021C95993|nr:uncharacterized protein LOC126991546 [Eriocheir sinensis]
MDLRFIGGVLSVFLLAALREGSATSPSHEPSITAQSSAHDAHDDAHARQKRQLHRILDPFGLLGKAKDAVSGAMDHLGQRIDEGAQQVGQLMQHGAARLDSAFKNHVGQMQKGLEEAGKVAGIIGEDLVESVSALVTNGVQDEAVVRKSEGFVDSFLRLVGIEPSQVGLMALNVLIFLAELITSSLVGDKLNEIPESRDSETSVLNWFMRGDPTKVEAMLKEAQDPGLPRAIINKLARATGDDTACVQLLVCKMSPLVWGLQRSVAVSQAKARSTDPDVTRPGLMEVLYDALPPLNTFVTFSESCENQFPACPLIDLSHLGLGL